MRYALFLLLVMSGLAQTNLVSTAPDAAQARLECLQSRRVICGKILKVLPEGLVVDSGYTDLLGTPWGRSWLVPGTVKARRATHLVEGREPDAICLGLVFLTDLPRKPKPKLYDYVNLEGFPDGHYTYTSVGDLQRTVRRFSHMLEPAVQWKLREHDQPK